MNIVDPKVHLVPISNNGTVKELGRENLKKIELIGKVCTKLEHTITKGSCFKFCEERLKVGHTSIFEHSYAYFDVDLVNYNLIKDLLILDSHIQVSYDWKTIGINLRSFLNILYNTRKVNNRIKVASDISELSDIVYVMLDRTPEIATYIGDKNYVINRISEGEQNIYFNKIERVTPGYVLTHCPEIYVVTFEITCDRGVTHELVRHRDFSFTQESTRYCNYSKGRFGKSISVIMPDDITCGSNGNIEVWSDAIAVCESEYKSLLENGISPQIARSILPNALKSDIYMTGTLDQWIGEFIDFAGKVHIQENKGFLPLRTDSNAHPQMIEIAEMIKDILYETYPNEIRLIKDC